MNEEMIEDEAFQARPLGRLQAKEVAPPLVESDPSLKVPLPNQMPPAPDLSTVPQHVLRSGAVEALISQNDDLMARLSVTLRRIAWLEEKLARAEREKEKHQFLYLNLKDQLLVVQEKAKAVADRKERTEAEFQELREQIRTLEIQCSELYTTGKERQAQAQERIAELGQRLNRFLRYRERVNQAHTKMKSRDEDRDRELRRTRLQHEETERNLLEARGECEDLRQRLTEAAEYIRVQAKKAEADQIQLVNQYEDRLSEYTQEMQRLEGTTEALRERVRSLEALYDKNLELENRLVHLKRKGEESRERMAGEIEQLSLQLAHYRTEAKDKGAAAESLSQELGETRMKLEFAEDNRRKLQEQVETVQALWRENQGQLEKQREKNEALQKLNQQLAARLHDYRREIHDLRVRLESTDIEARESARRDPQAPATPAPNTGGAERMQRIDALLAEIQSGMSMD